jgi:CRISPR/Cas system CSM-associated protein Csm5 (group 7 of RAMP superfamily)
VYSRRYSRRFYNKNHKVYAPKNPEKISLGGGGGDVLLSSSSSFCFA